MSAEKFEIYEAISRYFFALDQLDDAEAIGRSFTDDAIWECFDHGAATPTLRFERDMLEQAVAAQVQHPTDVLLRHHLCGLVFDELDGETARTTAKVLVTAQTVRDPAPRVRNTATCFGSWRKTPAGWRLTRWVIRRGPAGEA